MPFAGIGIGAASGLLPLSSLVGLLVLLLVIPLIKGLIAHAEEAEELMPVQGQNVVINLLTPVLDAVGLFIGWPR